MDEMNLGTFLFFHVEPSSPHATSVRMCDTGTVPVSQMRDYLHGIGFEAWRNHFLGDNRKSSTIFAGRIDPVIYTQEDADKANRNLTMYLRRLDEARDQVPGLEDCDLELPSRDMDIREVEL